MLHGAETGKRRLVLDFKNRAMWLLALVAGMALSLFVASSAGASSTFDYAVDTFELVGQGQDFTDDFNGSFDGWSCIFGTCSVSGGAMHLTNPGHPDDTLLNALGVLTERSDAVKPLPVVAGNGNFTLTSTWTTGLPQLEGDYFGPAITWYSGPNQREAVVAAAISMPVETATVAGVPSGLIMAQAHFTLNEPVNPDDTVATLVSFEGVSVSSGDLTGPLEIALWYDDTANTFRAVYSMDGGVTIASPFSSISAGSGILNAPSLDGLLFADPMESQASVPEPGEVMLMVVGLGGLVHAGRRRRLASQPC